MRPGAAGPLQGLTPAPLTPPPRPRLNRIPGNMAPGTYDSPMGLGTGAGVLFGNTGGVTEAAVRRRAWGRAGLFRVEGFSLIGGRAGLCL
jgi:hypothetical protein